MPLWWQSEGIKICSCLSVCVSICLSVCPSVSVHHTLWYRVCVIKSSHRFYWIISNFVYLLWTYWRCACGVLMDLEMILTELPPFELSHFSHSVVWSLCNQLLPQFHWIFFKPCILAVGVLKMCMWGFLGIRLILTELPPFKLSHCRQIIAL